MSTTRKRKQIHFLAILTITPSVLMLCAACEQAVPGLDALAPAVATNSEALLGSNGLPSNGLPSNGLPSNGLPSNGLPSNGLPSNGLPSNGLSGNGTFNNWFHWFSGCGTADGCDPNNLPAGSTGQGTATSRAQADLIMKYIVECACASGTTISYTDRTGAKHTWSGRLGLATDWCPASGTPAAASLADQEWVSACLMGVTNRNGSSQGSMQISMYTANPEFATQLAQTPQEAWIYYTAVIGMSGKGNFTTGVSYFYGNLFLPSNPSTGQYGEYAALYDPQSASMLALLSDLGRDCGIDGCGVMTPTGFAANVSQESTYFPDVYGRSPPAVQSCTPTSNYTASSCLDPSGRNWNRVLSVVTSYEWNKFYPNSQVKTNTSSPIPPGGIACSADVNGLISCTPSQVSTAKWMTHLSASVPLGALEQLGYTGKYLFRVRYKSTAPANVHFDFTNTQYTLPATGNRWTWFDMPISYTSKKPGDTTWSTLQLSYVDSSSANADLDIFMVYVDGS